jgi:RNA polymerase sigma-70 factor (ECF subfamily)
MMPAMARSLDAFRAELAAYARRLTGDEHEAQDCVQGACLAALRDAPPPDNPRAWLYRVVHNLAIDRMRGRAQAPPSAREAVAPDRRLEDREELEAMLAALPEEQRAILLLRYTHGLSFEEVAAVVGRPVGTVKVYAGRALSALQRMRRKE